VEHIVNIILCQHSVVTGLQARLSAFDSQFGFFLPSSSGSGVHTPYYYQMGSWGRCVFFLPVSFHSLPTILAYFISYLFSSFPFYNTQFLLPIAVRVNENSSKLLRYVSSPTHVAAIYDSLTLRAVNALRSYLTRIYWVKPVSLILSPPRLLPFYYNCLSCLIFWSVKLVQKSLVNSN